MRRLFVQTVRNVPTDLPQILYFFFKFSTRGLSFFGACVKLGSIEGFDISAVACARLLIPDPPCKLGGISPPLLPVRSVFFSGPVWEAAAAATAGTHISFLWLGEQRSAPARRLDRPPGGTARPAMAIHRSLDVNKRLQTKEVAD